MDIIAIFFTGYLFHLISTGRELKSSYVTVGNKKILVRDLPDKKNAAALMVKVIDNLTLVVDHLKKNKKSYTKKQQTIISRLKNYNPESIVENVDDMSFTSYTLNKGEKIALCLREEKGNGALKNLNLIMYVAIHELAHIGAKTEGHQEDFPSTFKFLLKEAQNIGVYHYENYAKNPQNYCEMKIDQNILDATHL